LVTRNEALRVAYIHVEETAAAEGKIVKEFYSKLVKADINGKDQVIGCFVCSLFSPCSLRSRLV
jgi:callose synthase